jgi:Family of unknown function (DUF6467)
VGDYETEALAFEESSLKYHPDNLRILTTARNPGLGQCLVGSLTGAVASQRVTEAREGNLRLDRNQLTSVRA